jgi:hypothetical protein
MITMIYFVIRTEESINFRLRICTKKLIKFRHLIAKDSHKTISQIPTLDAEGFAWKELSTSDTRRLIISAEEFLTFVGK